MADQPLHETRHEEEVRIATRSVDAGVIRARTRIETEPVSASIDRRVESLGELERVAVEGDDSGQVETLPDGSISIPLLEEELVITKRLVVRERVIVRKRTTVEEQRVEAELRREQISIEALDPGAEG